MALTRTPATPSLDLMTRYAGNLLRGMIPTGNQWFDPAALQPNGATLGQLLEMMTKLSGTWLQQTEALKHSTNLSGAVGTMLDSLGKGYGVPRLPGELDDLYAARIQQELLVERITRPAIEAGLAKLAPRVEVFEPWRRLPVASENWIASGDTPLGSADYWNAAVFEARLWGSSGDIPGVTAFLELTKAYGVMFWLAVYLPDQVIDYNDDPLAPQIILPTVGLNLPDPLFMPSRPNAVLGSTLELITDIIPEPVPLGFYPSGLGTPSGGLMASGAYYPEELYYRLDMVSEMFSPSGAAVYAMDVLPIAILDRNSPNRTAIITAGYEVSSYDPVDLMPNVWSEDDVNAGEAVGHVVRLDHTAPFTVETQQSDVQGACLIEQLV